MDFSQMIITLVIALALGALIGLERELAGKEAGIRTSMLVAGGSALFSMIAMSLPHIVLQQTGGAVAALAGSGYLNIIANIVVGIGFLGAGIIIKTESHVHGLTTAAVIWTSAAIGVLVGIGLTHFAVVATVIIAVLLYVLRKMDISRKISQSNRAIDQK